VRLESGVEEGFLHSGTTKSAVPAVGMTDLVPNGLVEANLRFLVEGALDLRVRIGESFF